MENKFLHEVVITAIIVKDGIYDELVMADSKRKGIKSEWKRFEG